MLCVFLLFFPLAAGSTVAHSCCHSATSLPPLLVAHSLRQQLSTCPNSVGTFAFTARPLALLIYFKILFHYTLLFPSHYSPLTPPLTLSSTYIDKRGLFLFASCIRQSLAGQSLGESNEIPMKQSLLNAKLLIGLQVLVVEYLKKGEKLVVPGNKGHRTVWQGARARGKARLPSTNTI